MRAALAIILALAVSLAHARPIDAGGNIGDYIRAIAAARGQRHEIAGDCMSACTMWLGATRVCVYPDAELWFHSARPPEGNAALLAFYPPRVRAFVIRHGLLNSSEPRGVPGWQLIGLGIPAC